MRGCSHPAVRRDNGLVFPAALRNRQFARLWAAQSITQFGGQLTYLSLPVAAYAATGSTTAFAGVFMASSLGIMLTMLVGGALADRFDRQRMMLASDLAMLAIVGALGLAVAAEAWWLVAGCAFVQTTTASLLKAGAALQRDIVPDAQRTQANALTQLALNTSQLVAPLAGIAIFLRWGFLPIIVIDMATTAISFLLLLRVRDPRTARKRDAIPMLAVARRVVTDIAEGGRTVVRDRWLRRQLPVNVISGLSNGMFIVAVIPWIDHTLDLPPSTFGVMIAVVGGAGLVASALLARFAQRVPPVRLIVAGGIFGVAGSAVFITPVPIPAVYAGLALFGACNVALSVGTTTARQRRFRGDVQGRLAALEMVNAQACSIAGMALAAILADVVGSTILMALVGGAIALSCLGDVFAARVLVREPVVADDAAADSDLALSA